MDSQVAPEYEHAALLTIDVQRDTLDGQPFEIPGTSAIVPSIVRLLHFFRSTSRPIIHVVRLYQRDGSNVDLCRRRAVEMGASLVIVGSIGSQLAMPLLPASDLTLDANLLLAGGIQLAGPKEWIIYKPRWGAFFRTPLEEHLRTWHVSTLVFAGCNFPNCPRASIYEASERDYRIVLVEDAMSGFDQRGRAELENIGVLVADTANILGSASAQMFDTKGP
jgi:nicotinamidase-related amidase